MKIKIGNLDVCICEYVIPESAQRANSSKNYANCFNMASRLSNLNIFDFTTAGGWDCVAAVEGLPALHYSVDFIFL